MSRFARELGPLAIGVTIFAAITAVLIHNGNDLGNWLLAAFFVGHGWAHITYLFPRPQASAATAQGPEWPFDLDHSWLAIDRRSLRLIGTALVVLTIAGYLLAAFATIQIIVPTELWLPLVIGSTIASATLLGIFFSPMLVIGLAIDIALIVAVLVTGWQPA